MTAQTDHWNQHARQWSLIGPPLRPAAQDVQLLETELCGWQKRADAGSPRALLCGVTPEIAAMQWPPGTWLTAIDHSRSMIAGVWPGSCAPGAAVCGSWFSLPLAAASQDILIGDGCYSLLVGRSNYLAFSAELRRVAAGGTLLLMRYFVRPQQPETRGAVIDDLWHGRIGNFHVFKWRLAMALHGSLEQGVRLGDIWNAWHEAVPDPARLAAQLGWREEVVNTISNYRGVDTRYSFPTLEEARALVGDFEIVSTRIPDYELGARCPTLVMRPK